MYSNGFLSRYHRFYAIGDILDCDVSLGLNVIFGKGCCRHIACLFNDTIKKNKMVGYRLNACNEKVAEKLKDKSFLHSFAKVIGNHVINSMIYNGMVYYFDPTNFRIYKLDEDVLFDDEQSYRLKNYYFHFLNDVSQRKFYEITNMPCYKGGYDEFDEVYRICVNNLDILE